MRIDAEWSVWEPRGFTWWGWHSAQRVWSEPAVEDRGFTLYRLHARAELFDGFEDTDEQVLFLNSLVYNMTLSGIVVSDQPGRIDLAASVYVHEEVADWARLLLRAAVPMQAAEAPEGKNESISLEQPQLKPALLSFSPIASQHLIRCYGFTASIVAETK
jgi:hypothetical protein